MSGGPWLTRLRLARDAATAALAPVLLPESDDERAGVAHRLLWTLFAGDPEATRDFLWREEGGDDLAPGRSRFLVLSARRPADPKGLFELDEPKPFTPVLAPGDRLRFALRANPVVTRKDPAGGRGKRHDVVMDRLRALPKGAARAEARHRVMQEAAAAWLAGQGERHGFALLPGSLRADGYDQLRIRRSGGRAPIEVSRLDLEGLLEVTEPAAFLAALAQGFGKAKAFGCGLMLIRRA